MTNVVHLPTTALADFLQKTKSGGFKPCLYNAVVILERHPDFTGSFALDEFSNQILKMREPPFGGGTGSVTERDGSEFAVWLGRPDTFSMAIPSTLALEAIETIAGRNKFHPVRNYLDALVWDGTPRIGRIMSDLFGADQNDYSEAVGKNFLIGAVARVRKPGCKVDTMLIFEGVQGLGKSSAIRFLCGPDWFAEVVESPSSKDFYQAFLGRWILEIAELQAFSKADANRVKQVITSQADNYRPSYGRYTRQFPRQCVFVGTTNDETYQRDHTGGRRFMPVRCREINLAAIQQNRDQLWAEADELFRQGATWWEYPASASTEQEDRFDADVWEEAVARWLGGNADQACYQHRGTSAVINAAHPIKQTTTAEIMRHALGIETSKQTKADQMRVGAILKHLKWGRATVREGDRQVRVYKAP